MLRASLRMVWTGCQSPGKSSRQAHVHSTAEWPPSPTLPSLGCLSTKVAPCCQLEPCPAVALTRLRRRASPTARIPKVATCFLKGITKLAQTDECRPAAACVRRSQSMAMTPGSSKPKFWTKFEIYAAEDVLMMTTCTSRSRSIGTTGSYAANCTSHAIQAPLRTKSSTVASPFNKARNCVAVSPSVVTVASRRPAMSTLVDRFADASDMAPMSHTCCTLCLVAEVACQALDKSGS
mmetsp:Transcript_28867/g.65202  ORF Transcript_28867/g.65202 Transcript_28867/m.65202 type:complete len:236 (+) Transcript_28867:477-1184(+)